ncbi:MAG: DUF2334 domain-containing protein [archaeon]
MNKKPIKIVIICILILLVSDILLIRVISPIEIDDVSPGISCEQKYLEKADILWVIPRFNNQSMATNTIWCNKIKGLNKTIGLHGVTHEYQEFKTDKDKEYLEEGIKMIEECLGKRPDMFKPPQLDISSNNKKLVEDMGLERKGFFNQLFHKVYHCNDTGMFTNKFIDLF